MIPRLRFSEFNESWSEVLLETVFSRVTGHTPSKKHKEYYGEDYSWVSLQDSSSLDNRYIYETKVKITALGIENSSAVLLPIETVIMTRDAGVGKLGVLGLPMAVSQHFVGWICKPKLYQFFLYYSLYRAKPEFERIAVGNTIKTIGMGYFKKMKVAIPILSEQMRISKLLFRFDDKIDLLTKKKEALENYKKGLMQKIFSQELRFKREDGTDYPEWETYCIADLGEFFNGLTGKNSSHFGHGNSQYVQYSQVFRNSYIKLDECNNVDVDDSDKQNALKEGDALFTTSSEVADEVAFASIVLNKPEIDTYLNSFCFGLRLNSLLAPSFAQYLFRTTIFRKAVYPLAQGSTRYNVSKKEIGKVKLLIPSVKEQNHIAKSFRILDSKIEQLILFKKKTEQLKKGLLQQMFV